ncbi:hypothetical protein VCRA2112O187_1200001 [Vibrio crassostreae]|nr:hypothetical protein VCRA2112O187_1200001 [Vibrio crassostreae]CAK2234371.1 hypothetical protein VCRA2113O198_70193 [Vibrio crassostreae]CAK2243234.1 hypothetical protein VCRA2110O178_80023 [Vibrio crassostreae]CAK2245823.1 hypothetical protein VCRA2113O204_80022 [Vibrio crassostreae]CAK2247576.1 hypothetical protein VCRA2113O201_80023 [Vibrio crassostreae]
MLVQANKKLDARCEMRDARCEMRDARKYGKAKLQAIKKENRSSPFLKPLS